MPQMFKGEQANAENAKEVEKVLDYLENHLKVNYVSILSV